MLTDIEREKRRKIFLVLSEMGMAPVAAALGSITEEQYECLLELIQEFRNLELKAKL